MIKIRKAREKESEDKCVRICMRGEGVLFCLCVPVTYAPTKLRCFDVT